MKKLSIAFWLLCFPLILVNGCGSNSSGNGASVTGKASFILGPSAVSRAPQTIRSGVRLSPNNQYLISPTQAKITFTSIVFRDASGNSLGTSTLSNCVVTYDRTKPSGTSLLDCPLSVPVGQIAQMSVGFSTTVQVLENDTTTPIYSHPSGFDTTAANPGFVNVLVTAGASSTERSTPVIFAAPVTVAAGSTPQIFITTDMIHGIQLQVDQSGTTLSPSSGSQDPVALFGGFSKGASYYLSEDTTIESVVVGGKRSVRIFYDANGQPLYLIGFTCGADGGPKGAWASPPIGATIGGWLGKDSTNKISWALPTDTTYATYSAYLIMPEQTTVGMSTPVQCKATASVPPPADGKTYASGAPAMASPTSTATLNLLAK